MNFATLPRRIRAALVALDMGALFLNSDRAWTSPNGKRSIGANFLQQLKRMGLACTWEVRRAGFVFWACGLTPLGENAVTAVFNDQIQHARA